MLCNLSHRCAGRGGAGLALCVVLAGAPTQGSAQQPLPGQTHSASPSLPGYRPPTIVLAQPAESATLPQDKPVVVFRFAAGEANDPIDLASLAVTVDGIDRTESFQVTGAEAWGALGAGPADSSLALGIHQLSARICSARGACGGIVTSLTVVPSQIGAGDSQPAAEGQAADSSSSASSRRWRVIDVILDALKKLFSL